MNSDLSLISELLAFLIMTLSWGYSSCLQQKLLLSALTASNFQIYQHFQFCLPLPCPPIFIMFSYGYIPSYKNRLWQSLSLLLNLLLFLGMTPEELMHTHQNQLPTPTESIPRAGMGMRRSACGWHYYINDRRFITSDHDFEGKWLRLLWPMLNYLAAHIEQMCFKYSC